MTAVTGVKVCKVPMVHGTFAAMAICINGLFFELDCPLNWTNLYFLKGKLIFLVFKVIVKESLKLFVLIYLAAVLNSSDWMDLREQHTQMSHLSHLPSLASDIRNNTLAPEAKPVDKVMSTSIISIKVLCCSVQWKSMLINLQMLRLSTCKTTDY